MYITHSASIVPNLSFTNMAVLCIGSNLYGIKKSVSLCLNFHQIMPVENVHLL